MATEHVHPQTYQDLFIHRTDVHAQQTKTGSYFLTRSSVTDAVIRSHLQGEITAGFYALSLDHTTRWAVLDADQEDGLDQLQEAWRQLDARGISSQLELSRRGGHLWILFEPIAASVARRLVLGALPDLEGVEVFPKQDRLDPGMKVGNLVRGPLGIHRLTGRRYPFVDPISLNPVSTSIGGAIDYLGQAPRITTAQAAEQLAVLLHEARHPPPAPQQELLRPPRSSTLHRSPIEEMKERIGDLHCFVSQFVELDPQGRGSCPFHPPDRHPSFAVDRERGFWVCYHQTSPKTGRYIGGDAIEFYKRLKGLSYKDALRELGQLYPEE